MATKIELRNQRVSDAKRFFEILNNPNFKYFHVCPKDLEAEKEFLRQNPKKRKNNLEYIFQVKLDLTLYTIKKGMFKKQLRR